MQLHGLLWTSSSRDIPYILNPHWEGFSFWDSHSPDSPSVEANMEWLQSRAVVEDDLLFPEWKEASKPRLIVVVAEVVGEMEEERVHLEFVKTSAA